MIDTLKPLIKQFLPFAQERMGFKNPPRLFLKQDAQNAGDPLGKTAFYDPSEMSVTLYVMDRHPKDIMRSLSHELVHHTQNCNGQFENAGEMGEGYAQNNEHMREMERQAYEMGNLCFRDWEDSIKSTIYFEHLQKGVNNSMSTKEWKNGEINTLLTEKWGFSFNLDRLNEKTGDDETEEKAKKSVEGEGTSKEEEDDLEEGLADAKTSPRPRKPHGSGDKCYDDKGDRVECLEEKAAFKKGDETAKHGAAFTGETEEEREKEGKITEDSGEEEGMHYRDNAMSDEDHIKAIRHHLEALEGDRDYDEDHESLEEGGSGRKDKVRMQSRDTARDSVDRKRPMQEAELRKFMKEVFKRAAAAKAKKER